MDWSSAPIAAQPLISIPWST